MIELRGIDKEFDGHKAIEDVSLEIRERTVFGLIGTNGAGKSTTLRVISGVYRADDGEVLIDGQPVFDNVEAKKKIFFISDEPYFLPNSNAGDMMEFYAGIYENFDKEEFGKYIEAFGLAPDRKINTYSKGMKKQLAILLGLCSRVKYLLCDETFDGLDPVMRQTVKSLMAREIEDRGITVVIASHNLRELEDICDRVGLLHKGGVLMSKDLEDMKLAIQKVQCVFKNEEDAAKISECFEVVKDDKRGQLHTITLRATREETESEFAKIETVFCEILPLSLEEIFISETEVNGYDIRKIILG